MATIQELNAQRAQLVQQLADVDQQIAELQKGRRQEAIGQVRAMLAEFGLTVADLGAAPAGAPRAPRAPRVAGESSPAKAPGKIAAKYRDAATGDSWTGRGLKPRWLTAALAAGRTIEEFKV